MNFINVITGLVNYNKIADDYTKNDRSYMATYMRNHVEGPLKLLIALEMVFIVIGCIISAISAVSKPSTMQPPGTRQKPVRQDRFRNNRGNGKPPYKM
jgi:hypothetical protein